MNIIGPELFDRGDLAFLKRREHSTRCRLLMPELSFDDKYLWTDKDFGRPSGTGFLSASLPRHFVPGYDQPVPPGQEPFVHRSASQLGLALTRKIVELQGGTIDMESEVGKGSTFTVVLPLVMSEVCI